jgi:hypothetical protein
MVSAHHKMILSGGRFSGTSRGKLSAAFDAFAGSVEKDILVVHFHGGLVSEHAAEGIAERLLPVYQGAGGYPLFVIWQSGIGETLKNNWLEIGKEEVMPVLVERVLQFVIGKLDRAPGEKGGEIELPSRFAIQDEIREKQGAGEVPFAAREAEMADFDAGLTPAEQAQFDALLTQDATLATAALELGRAGAPALSPGLEAELDKARTARDVGEKGLISTATLVAAGVRILARTLHRFANGRDHGIYTTVVEEVARELKGDLLGGIVWKHMKKDTADSFEGSGDTHGGTALLGEIVRLRQAGRKPRIVLVGHSTGAVYIGHLLEKATTMLPAEVRFEVVFLAPACSFKLLDRALASAGDRIASFRSFGLEDAIEKRDAIFPPLYPRSLLYFVAGVVEEAVDLPLVGMQRYHSGAPPFDAAGFPEITRVRDRLAVFPAPWIWSESREGAGLSTLAHKHGDVDNDPVTLKSVTHLIAKGVA